MMPNIMRFIYVLHPKAMTTQDRPTRFTTKRKNKARDQPIYETSKRKQL